MKAICTIGAVVLLSCTAFATHAGEEAAGRKPDAASENVNPPDWDQVMLEARIFLGRLPDTMPGAENDTPEKIALGKRLYFERGISCNESQSCNDCHLITDGKAGVDNRPTSAGAMGTFGKRNSPTVINAGFQAAQFWDGRAETLAEQAKGPVLNPIEMGMTTPAEVVTRIKNTEGYEEAFRGAFPGAPEPVTYDNIADAIAAFERTLVARSRFDDLLCGNQNALTAKEKRGLAAFVNNSCIECHTGATVGGRVHRKLGEQRPYENREDLGRYEVTKMDKDRQVFKVPMLRNVTRTGPYFHHGQVQTLDQAVQLMGQLQLGVDLSAEMVSDIIAFLGTLEGNPPVDATREVANTLKPG